MAKSTMTALRPTRSGYHANGAEYLIRIVPKRGGPTMAMAKRAGAVCEMCGVSLPSHPILGCALGELL